MVTSTGASLNHHCLSTSLLFLASCLLNHQTLPRSNLDTRKLYLKEEILNKTEQLKSHASRDDICVDTDDKYSQTFEVALNYVRNMKFDEMPDYMLVQQP